MNAPIAASSSARLSRAWPARSLVPRGGVTRQARQAHLVDRVHVPFDLSPAAWSAWQGKHQPHTQVGGDLLHMLGDEIGSVVGVEHARDAADVPAGLGLAPDRLP